MFISNLLFVLAITHPEHNLVNCGNEIEIDPRYDLNLNRTNLRNSMFYCHYEYNEFSKYCVR